MIISFKIKFKKYIYEMSIITSFFIINEEWIIMFFKKGKKILINPRTDTGDSQMDNDNIIYPKRS